MSVISHEWIGMWECEAPLSHEEVNEDRPLLEAFMRPIPDGVQLESCTIWVHGRTYRWRRIDVMGFKL